MLRANVRILSAAAAVAVSLMGGRARADVFEQVPTDAAAVFEIKDLGALNDKVIAMAKTFGLDEINPDMKDPLGTLLEKGHMTKGVNKAGDAAMVIFAPDKSGEMKEEPIALVPVSDYTAFVGNFTPAEDAKDVPDGVTAVKDPDGGKNLYVAHRGDYAMVSDSTGHMKHAAGLKLSGVVASELKAKDAIFYINMPVVRERALPELQSHRKEWLEDMHKALAQEAQFKPFAPVLDTVVNEGLDAAERFLTDGDSVVMGGTLSDDGLLISSVADFTADSKSGQFVAQIKPGEIPLLAGLPDHKYFAFGGSSVDSKVLAPLVKNLADPVVADLRKVDNKIAGKIADILDTVIELSGTTQHAAAGWVMPSKPMGQESLLTQVQVVNGDAKAMAGAEKKIITETNDLLAALPTGGPKTKMEMGEAKTIEGVELQSFTTKLDVDENDPKGAQAQQILAMVYGPAGMTGNFGVVDEKTFVITQGASDDLIKELIDAAKSGKDVLSDSPGVKMVSGHLPKDNVAVYYIALDNIVTTAVRYAQGFGLPIKMKLPHDLPPIGIAVGAEGSAVRVDTFVPAKTVQSLVSAGLQAYSQFQQGNKGGGL